MIPASLPLSYTDLVAIREVVLDEIRTERQGNQLLPEHFQLAEARMLNYFLGNITVLMMNPVTEKVDDSPAPAQIMKEDIGVKEQS